MKTVPLVLAVLALLPAQGALARGHDSDNARVLTSCCDRPARWASRHDPGDARLAITTEAGEVTLLLTEDVVAVQLSDRVLHRVKRELKENQDDGEDNVFARTIKTVVLSSVRAILDHSIECDVSDLSNVEYRHGRLIFTTEDGGHIFDHLDVSDEDAMQGFSDQDARAFVREFHRMKSRIR